VKQSSHPNVVLISGASSGFGLACLHRLARLGHRVYGTSRRTAFPDTAPAAALPLIIPMDVRDDASVEAAVAFVLQHEGRLDVLVNNAGFALAGAVEDTSPEQARSQFETNFFGVHRVCRSVLPAMRDQGSGLIVNIGSMGGLTALPFQGFYCASKYALEALTESLRMELRPFGVQATLIDPGDFKTGITASRVVVDAAHDAYRARQDAALAVTARDERQGAGPDQVAVLLARILEQPRVRPRYLAGAFVQKLAVRSKRFLPAAWFEKLIMSYYRV
jgi:NAD(P)-dependent dehydrogenase (short-subunit alcohol dehydrogenase family)